MSKEKGEGRVYGFRDTKYENVLKYRIGPEIRDYSVGSWPGEPILNRGLYMRISDDLRKCVVFLGYKDNKEPGNIKCIGTGFLFMYKELTHLVTVKHVALQLGGYPFVIRVNRVNGEAENIHADQIEWFYHNDESVDLAVTPCTFQQHKYDALYIPETLIKPVGEYNLGIGDICYTIGLFGLLYGKKRNYPIVFTGNIALLPEGEKIPVKDKGGTKYIEGYLVGSQSLGGLSGAPVFARPTTDIKLPCLESTEEDVSGERFSLSDVFLIGVWSGSWYANPDQVLTSEIGMGEDIKVPVGVGVVTPIEKLIELMESPEMQKKRADYYAERESKVHAADLDAVTPSLEADNPNHKEDFNSLLTVAVKKKPQADET